MSGRDMEIVGDYDDDRYDDRYDDDDDDDADAVDR